MGSAGDTLSKENDLQSIYVNCCSNLPDDKTVIVVGSHRVEGASDLFYAPVSVRGQSTLRGMLDSGSMSCTLGVEAESKLRAADVLPSPVPEKVVLISCGGLTTQPSCIYDLEIELYGSKFVVPTFLVPGQRDELIIGSNVLRPIIQRMKSDEKYWELIHSNTSDPDCEQFLQLLSCITRWSGPELPDKVGTVRLRQAVTLAPQGEYLVWGKLPSSAPVSPGSTIIVEPTSSHSAPKDIIVGRVLAPTWGDRSVPMKILNPTMRPVSLRRNAKVADVFPCVVVEDLPLSQGVSRPQSGQLTDPNPNSDATSTPFQRLKDCGLADINLGGCEVSDEWKQG